MSTLSKFHKTEQLQRLSMEIDKIYHGDCLTVLKTFPDSSFDSILTDPPYGLGGRDPTPEETLAYLQGADLNTGEFMNKDWDLPSVLVWKECLRVLKPGGYLMSFAGTRTLDILSIGIRMAGFTNRDTVPVEMGPPILRWVRAQGMPKNVDVSKEFRKAGLTELSVQWAGYGTALKPYWEPILVFRKPIEESTLLKQVASTGTGVINIEASRIKHSSLADLAKHKAGVDAIKARGGKMGNSWKNSSDLSGANDVSNSGRLPPNIIFVHSDLCRKVGTQTVAMPPINRFDDGAKPFGGGAGHEYTSYHREDETLDVWECHPSCPIHHLNQQYQVPDGGVAKYFLNVDPDSLFFYVTKPNLREKIMGLEEGEENLHATVKPVKLMEYLVTMATPAKGIVLDLYCGSGTTCVAAVNKGFHFVGIEKEEPSVKTARSRVQAALQARKKSEEEQESADLVFGLESE
jgi:DNA modification methylase